MSQLINKIVKCKTNDWGIWDPGPNALEWCADGPMSTAASLVAISNKNYVYFLVHHKELDILYFVVHT